MSDYRRMYPCQDCQKNLDEICDNQSTPCNYYRNFQEGRKYGAEELAHKLSNRIQGGEYLTSVLQEWVDCNLNEIRKQISEENGEEE